eukprot:PLAT1722.1.p1 GENE.PLAT1722.1~~PLAT1722.1.p1  ORF type:complete len:315 (-),score=147.16 PLAT1722.1:67-975(-)
MNRSVVLLVVLAVLAAAQSSPLASKVVRMRGNVEVRAGVTAKTASSPSSKASSTSQAVVGRRLKADSVQTDSMSTLEAETLRISSPTGKLRIKGLLEVHGAIHYKSVAPAVAPTALLQTGEEQVAPAAAAGMHAAWQLVSSDAFGEGSASGWTVHDGDVGADSDAAGRPAVTTHCGDGNWFLGGHCQTSAHSLRKTFTNLRTHTQLRLRARMHFLDSWDGETAFAKMDGSVVWLDSHAASPAAAAAGLNLCGGDAADLRMGAPMDVIIPHSADSVTVVFASLLEHAACDRSFGVDDVELLLR